MSQNNYYNNSSNNSNNSGSGNGSGGSRYSGGGYSGGGKKSINYANGGSSYRSADANEWDNSGRRSGRDYYSGYRGSGGGGGGGSSSYSRYDQYGGGRDRDRLPDRGPGPDRERGPEREWGQDRERGPDRDRERGYKSHGKSSYVPSSNPRDRDREGNRRRYDKYDSYSGAAGSGARSGSGSSGPPGGSHATSSTSSTHMASSSFPGSSSSGSGRYNKPSSGSQSEYRRNSPIEGTQDPRRGSYQGDFRKSSSNSNKSNFSSRKSSPNPSTSSASAVAEFKHDQKIQHIFEDENNVNGDVAKPDAQGKETLPKDESKSEGSNGDPIISAESVSEKDIISPELKEETQVEPTKDDTEQSNPTSKSKDSSISNIPNLEKTKSDVDIANSSMLSPVGESVAIDESFLSHMATIKESNNIKDEADLSEAETIPSHSPPKVTKGRRLVRKLEFDQEREKLKRRYYSDEDDEDDKDFLTAEKIQSKDLQSPEGKDDETDQSKDVFSKDKKDVKEEKENEDQGENDKSSKTKIEEDEEEEKYEDDGSDEQSEDEEKVEEEEEKEEEEIHVNKSKSKIIDRPYKLKRDSTGRSLLQRACGKGSLKEVKDYIERGADPNECDYCGFTCLHEAALEGHSKVVEYLISQGADVNKQAQKAGDLETPLIDAAENKHLETVKVLLANGADPRVYNLDGFTALTKIFNEHDGEQGYEDIIQVLEEANGKFNREEKAERDKLREDLEIPRVVEDPNDVYFSDLLKKKNHANSIYKYAAEGIKEFTANYFVEGGRLDHKPDILILAARNGHSELVDIILGLNPGPYDIDQENGCGLTALVASVGRGHTEIVKFLLSKGADPSKIRRQDGLSCLEIAQGATHYDVEEVKILQKHLQKRGVLDEQTDERIANEKPDISTRKTEGDNKPKDADSKKRKSTTISDDGDKKFKKSKSKEPEKIPEKNPEKVHEKPLPQPKPSSVFAKETTPEMTEKPRPRDHTLSPKSEEGSFKRPSGSLSPVPVLQQQVLTKEQEELRVKNAEEARQWQEKVEAKKRARRDMFLRAEREKERKRKEDEERRAKEEEESAKAKIEEDKRKAIEEAHKVKEITEQRDTLERELIFKNYPIGLQQINEAIPAEQFGPLYTFKFDNTEDIYVTDLQVALLTSIATNTLHESISQADSIIPLTSIQKSKIWNLFFPMIGIDRRSPFSDIFKLSHEGHEKFKNLVINFIPLREMNHITGKKLNDEYYVSVDLESLQEFSDSGPNYVVPSCGGDNLEIIINSDALLESRFVPPRLRRRADVLKTLQSTSTPLW
ncbi:hypothetical protein CLIB1423_01S05094 [[Candida] railenensis]|uniref:Uncharacterized protein n=1 Tax=[Candida] railenensis TaxID=45579 RepID=A0A9P0QKA1_9ASCO|nr:hypothetical protein CLIB1423_01S05094 [[Candida] railenensis]